uniref:Cation/H+ exchanger domain-containing protein n=1 Tax=Bicosoecida sp. CB-2014 TaxID=1486930 RepID=A0A7S1C6E0_9STRA
MALFPLLTRMGYGVNWKEGLIMVWGGLRGAVGLALGLLVELDPNVPKHTKTLINFHISGIVFLTLLVNGTTAARLYSKLDIYPVNPYREVLVRRALGMLEREGAVHMDAVKKLWEHQGTHARWTLVRELVPRFEEAMVMNGRVTLLPESVPMVFRHHINRMRLGALFNAAAMGIITMNRAKMKAKSAALRGRAAAARARGGDSASGAGETKESAGDESPPKEEGVAGVEGGSAAGGGTDGGGATGAMAVVDIDDPGALADSQVEDDDDGSSDAGRGARSSGASETLAASASGGASPVPSGSVTPGTLATSYDAMGRKQSNLALMVNTGAATTAGLGKKRMSRAAIMINAVSDSTGQTPKARSRERVSANQIAPIDEAAEHHDDASEPRSRTASVADEDAGTPTSSKRTKKTGSGLARKRTEESYQSLFQALKAGFTHHYEMRFMGDAALLMLVEACDYGLEWVKVHHSKVSIGSKSVRKALTEHPDPFRAAMEILLKRVDLSPLVKLAVRKCPKQPLLEGLVDSLVYNEIASAVEALQGLVHSLTEMLDDGVLELLPPHIGHEMAWMKKEATATLRRVEEKHGGICVVVHTLLPAKVILHNLRETVCEMHTSHGLIDSAVMDDILDVIDQRLSGLYAYAPGARQLHNLRHMSVAAANLEAPDHASMAHHGSGHAPIRASPIGAHGRHSSRSR